MPDSKSSLDRLGARLRKADTASGNDAAMYGVYRESFAPALSEVGAACFAMEAFAALPVSARFKTLESTVAKLRRGSFRLSQIQDIAGVRLVMASERDQDFAVAWLTSAFSIATVTDYRRNPQNGYRAVHVICTASDGKHVEVQVRTIIQNVWANVSERVAARFGIGLKYGQGDGVMLARLSEFGESGAALENAMHLVDVQVFVAALASSPLRDVMRAVELAAETFNGHLASWSDILGEQ